MGQAASRRSADNTRVRLSCVDDDNQRQPLEILWEKELGPQVLTGEAWNDVAAKGFNELEALLATQGEGRAKWIKDQSDQKITGTALAELKAAETIDDLLAVLDKKITGKVTLGIVPEYAIVLQPSDERLRSGSQYTQGNCILTFGRTQTPVVGQRVLVRSTNGAEADKFGKFRNCPPPPTPNSRQSWT